MKYYWHYEYPIGSIGVAEADGHIVKVFFVQKDQKSDRTRQSLEGFEKRETPLVKKCAKQLGEYFDGKRLEFDLPLFFEGTDFQRKIWALLLTIPYGKTRSYGDIAKQAGTPKGARAVGLANNRNPIAIICPCHRVIGSDGSLVGYAGGLAMKQQLLDMEAGKK